MPIVGVDPTHLEVTDHARPTLKRRVRAGDAAVFGVVAKIIEAARNTAARSVIATITAAYRLIGRHLVESEQAGTERAEYGATLKAKLAMDLA